VRSQIRTGLDPGLPDKWLFTGYFRELLSVIAKCMRIRCANSTTYNEPKWNAVAQAIRENAINMDTLIAENRKTPPQDMTAVEDLKSYQKYAQAHVDGLKNLIASFATLYDSMPDDQKRIADDVFRTSERERSPAPVVYGPFFPFFPFFPFSR
jgi:hypothetical protein